MSLGQDNKIFSSLSGHWQVQLAPESKEISAFSTTTGHFERLRLLFGLKSASITFQRMINTLFADMLGENIYEKLDDLIIRSKNGDNHLADLEAVLPKLKEARLKANLTKCEFLKAKITFLGHTVDGSRIHTLDDKISAIMKFPQLRIIKNVRSFIELCGYYRPFIDGFAKIASH